MIIASGDLVNELPFGNEVVNKLREANAIVVKGNKEQYFIDYDKYKFNWKNIQFQNTLYMKKELTKENLEYVETLPFEIDLEINGVKLKVVHATPYSLTEIIKENDNEKIDDIISNLDNIDIYICGHTHDPIWYKKVRDTMYINGGCLGLSPFNPKQAEYVIIDISEDGTYQIEAKIIEYDVEKLKQKLQECDILKTDKVFMNLMFLVTNGRPDVRRKFFSEASELMAQKGDNIYMSNVEGIYSTFKMIDDDVWKKLEEKYKHEFLL